MLICLNDRLKSYQKECVAIENSAHGVLAGQTTGMFCIGFNGSGNFNQVQKANVKVGAYHTIDVDNLFR